MEKTTGWKVPVIFALAILGISLAGYMLIPERRMPSFPEELTQQAQGTRIDLEQEENKEWKKALVEAASGFSQQDSKDQKVQLIISQALAQNKLDVACAGIVLIKTESIRKEATEAILAKALESCATVHFGLCAIREEGTEAERIRNRFAECKKGAR